MVGIQNSILVLHSSNGFKIHESLKGTDPQSIAFDPQNSDRAYCGTFGEGLWKTYDGGQTWDNVGKDDISSPYVMSVAVSSLNNENRINRVYAGTEPSALYVSDDGGDSWEKMEALNKLPSSKSWSFPPRPWTHHIRWIEPDANNPDYVFAAIEAGALVQSHDGGKTWIDRVEGGPYDTHSLVTHPKAQKRLYSSAGDGYFESFDYGESWTRSMEGLKHSYLYGLAVDSGNPQVVIVSASLGPNKAYSTENAESRLKTQNHLYIEKMNIAGNGEPFQMVFLNQVGQQLLFLLQIQRFQESSTQLTIAVYLCRLIQVFHGENLILHGQENIFHKLLGRLQLAEKVSNSRI
jgi:photosystem II stability/assembly factor-like uncharacterized protein